MIGDFLSSISCPFFPNRLFHVHLLLCPSCPGREEIVDRRLTRERVCSTIFVIEERLKKATNWYYANCQRPAESRTMSIHPKKDLIKNIEFFQRVILTKHEFLLLFKRRSLGISSLPPAPQSVLNSSHLFNTNLIPLYLCNHPLCVLLLNSWPVIIICRFIIIFRCCNFVVWKERRVFNLLRCLYIIRCTNSNRCNLPTCVV